MNTKEILCTNLTVDQYNAVVDQSKYILCLACAGSGKSRTLAYKIAYLISQGEAPESIIAFTFTEKAAESIKRRVAEALKKFNLSENNIGAMFIGTLDSFCQKLLGDINARYRQYDILDQNRLILYVMSRLNRLDVKNNKKYFKNIKDLTNAWQTLNNENISLESIKQYDISLYNSLKKLSDLFDNDGFMDFSYAISLAVTELKKINSKNSYLDNYKFLFVDEYQDINPIQEEFIKILSNHLDMLFVVGDDDQSIYGWRGANVQNILTFKDRYENVSIHRLLVNFRSTKAIVETANNFIQKTITVERLPKSIKYHSNGNIQDLRKLWFENRVDEAKWVANRIKSLIGTTYIEYNADGTEKNRRGLTYSDFAVLLRGIHSKNSENRDLQFVEAIRELNIPVKTTGEGGIFDRPYAKCILGIMELLRENKKLDRYVVEKYFEDEVLTWFPSANKIKFIAALQDQYNNIYMSIESSRRKVYPQKFFHQLLDALMLKNLTDETALKDLGLFSEILKDIEQTYISIDSATRYREMLNFLQNIANDYELETIDYISKTDAVNVSTIHRVKGLEFPVVFVVDLVNQRFPVRRSDYIGLLPDELMENAKSRGAYGNRRNDEARLFYTAITRAERLLYLSGSAVHKGLKYNKKPSEFLVGLEHPDMRKDTNLDCLASKITPQTRFDDNELPTNFSSVKAYLICPYMYKLQNLYGYNTFVPELFGFGLTTHTILERLHQKYKERIPSEQEIDEIIESTFMLKHVFPSKNPETNPGSYERAKNLVHHIINNYVKTYSSDFSRLRQDEARFELLVDDALISGSIDLLLKEDEIKSIESAEVIDFKSMDIPENNEQQDWRELSIQVQLYSKAAREIIGQNVQTGFVHVLKNNKRVAIPIDEKSVQNAVELVEWAVKGIIRNDFPMRGCKSKCSQCDFKSICKQKRESFLQNEFPPKVNTPNGLKTILALEED